MVDPVKVKEKFIGMQKIDKYQKEYFQVESPIYMEDEMKNLKRITGTDNWYYLFNWLFCDLPFYYK